MANSKIRHHEARIIMHSSDTDHLENIDDKSIRVLFGI